MASSASKVALYAILAVVVVGAIAVSSPVRRFLSTQVAPGEESLTINNTLRLSVDPNGAPGDYGFQIAWHDPFSNTQLALSDPVFVTVPGAPGSGSGSDDDDDNDDDDDRGSSGGSSGGTGGTGSRDDDDDKDDDDDNDGLSAHQGESFRTFTYQAERGHTITGSFSGVQRDGNREVVRLAHTKAGLERSVQVPRGDYWLDATVRHDRPGPTTAVIYLNDRAWKVIRLDRNDDRYRTHRIGQLRNFAGGTIRFRLLNDEFDPANPTNEETDQNLFVDWWRLTTVPGLAIEGTESSQDTSSGWELLPRLNSIIREELGSQFVTFQVWQYYARRLVADRSNPDSIQTEQQLRDVMQFWLRERPELPIGN